MVEEGKSRDKKKTISVSGVIQKSFLEKPFQEGDRETDHTLTYSDGMRNKRFFKIIVISKNAF